MQIVDDHMQNAYRTYQNLFIKTFHFITIIYALLSHTQFHKNYVIYYQNLSKKSTLFRRQWIFGRHFGDFTGWLFMCLLPKKNEYKIPPF